MAYNAQNSGYGRSDLPGAQGVGQREDAYETGQAGGLQQPGGLGLGQNQPQAGYGGGGQGGLKGAVANVANKMGASGMNDVCDPPNVFNPNAADGKTERHVQDGERARTYEAPTVHETVVHHDVERIKPVLHQEVHKTRLHEQVHHKTEAPRDLGITEVIRHGETDPCGGNLNTDLNAVRGEGLGGARHLPGHHGADAGVLGGAGAGLAGAGAGAGLGGAGTGLGGPGAGLGSRGTSTSSSSSSDSDNGNVAGVGGLHRPGATGTGMAGTGAAGTGLAGTGLTGTGATPGTGYGTGATGTTMGGAGTTGTGYGTGTTNSTYNNQGVAGQPQGEVKGIKKVINKVVPGPGPFYPS